MTANDIGAGFLAGVLSFLSPEAWLLLPLLASAAGAAGRAGVGAAIIGMGCALALTGMLGTSFNLEAVWLRRIVCGLLLLQGTCLMSESLVERFSLLTGGARGFSSSADSTAGSMFRQFLLAFLLGAHWLPRVGPVLGQASVMAADARNISLALEILFAFGVGAALPWIVLGRGIRMIIGDTAGGGMSGKRFLGLLLLAVGALGLSELDAVAIQTISPFFPSWARAMVIKY